MSELSKKRITALVGILLAAAATSPFATNLALLGKPGFNAAVGGISGAVFLVGFIMAISIFQKK